MSLDLAGDQLQFAYVQPRPGMIEAGARPGSQLFDGRLQGAHISGVARIFSWQCGQFPYRVDGEVSSDGTHITLTGAKPRVDRATCAPKGSTPDVLNFDLNSGPALGGAVSRDDRFTTPLPPPDGGHKTVPMLADGGTFKVPVAINGQLTLDFIVDSGAADVSIPADVVLTLIRTGTLAEADFLDSQTYRMADGSTVPSQRFRIRSLKVGDTVLENVTGSVAPVAGSLLLGQSFLTRFKSWSIDNLRQALVLN
jgi:clan AA aspartic protease (TIGR02281 family)